MVEQILFQRNLALRSNRELGHEPTYRSLYCKAILPYRPGTCRLWARQTGRAVLFSLPTFNKREILDSFAGVAYTEISEISLL